MVIGSISRRQLVRSAILFLGVTPLMAACGGAPAAPTAAPAPPTAPPPTTAPAPTAAPPTAPPTASASTPAPVPTNTPVPAVPTAPTAPAPTQAPSRTPLLNIAAGGDIDTADPQVSPLLMFNNIVRLTCFSSLVRYTPTLDYVGDLAEKWENADDKTYIFHLRQGVKYHNGQEVQASDVEFSLKRIGDKKTIFSSRVANIDKYEVLDKYTIKITLKKPQADFIDGLILLSIAPQSAEADLAKKPIGSGPFKFTEWVPNDHITIDRFPDYFEPDVARADRITFKIIPEAQVAVTNLLAGSIDGMLDLQTSQAVFFKASKEVKAVIQATSAIHTFELMGKNIPAIRTNPKVRQALAYCLDKAAVQKTVYSGEGRSKWTWVPHDSWAYKDYDGYPYDPDKAKALLKEAGVPSNFELTVIIPGGYPDGEKTSTIWQAGLAKAGVKLNLKVQELAVWVDNYVKRTYDVTWNAWPGFADPNYFVGFGLQPLLADTWKNPDAAKLADDANATLDQTRRKDLYGKLQDIFVSDLPVIVVQEVPQASLIKPNLMGWQINPLGFVLVKGASLSAG